MPRWTPEARAAQAAKIRGWQPWMNSTGPKTVAGKERCKLNAEKHGYYGSDARRERMYLNALLLAAREQAREKAARGRRPPHARAGATGSVLLANRKVASPPRARGLTEVADNLSATSSSKPHARAG